MLTALGKSLMVILTVCCLLFFAYLVRENNPQFRGNLEIADIVCTIEPSQEDLLLQQIVTLQQIEVLLEQQNWMLKKIIDGMDQNIEIGLASNELFDLTPPNKPPPRR